jgi:TATA-box binding protein (TBP) (component of TFIID and TFIIIB)
MNSTNNQSIGFDPRPYKVSTITATGGVGALIDLDIFYNNVELATIDDTAALGSEGFIYIEFGKKKSETVFRGYHKKLEATRRKKKESKRFDNQVTVILKTINGLTGLPQHVNVKVFKNGNIQMTGLKCVEQGKSVVDFVIKQLHTIHKNGFSSVVSNQPDTLTNNDYRIRLINSDFRIGIEIKRDKLNKLVQDTYNLLSSFEPCIYPGVKIQYFWNMSKPKQDGVCYCSGYCSGKGCGDGEGQCKKITIAAFQSGSVIITGAQTHVQIESAYEFICKIIKQHETELRKVLPALLLEAEEV